MNEPTEIRWLMLLHQIPPKPAYLRVKIWRRLQRLGAVPVKSTVYVLPKSEQTQEDFQWVLREIVGSGGDASLCEARFVEGLSDHDVQQLFRAARDADYEAISKEAQRLSTSLTKKPKFVSSKPARAASLEIERLRKRLAEVAEIDFFNAPGRETTERLLFALDARWHNHATKDRTANVPPTIEQLQGRTWVTRKRIYVDRMASAWLIGRFVDPSATFKFVPVKGYQPSAGELRFDMFEADFTHEGDRCTFEVLLDRAGLKDPGLQSIAEIVHAIDLKDMKFAREETVGIERLITGITLAHKEDEKRLERAAAIFDDLYEYFQRKGPAK